MVVVVLDPSPLSILRPEASPQSIMSFDERASLLRDCGADEVVKVPVSAALLELSPAEFLDRYIAGFNPAGIVAGPDFRFGKSRAGDVEFVRAFFKGVPNFAVGVAAQTEVALGDHSVVPARSSMVRWLLMNGRVRDAASVLSRPHRVIGTVVRGDRRGRMLGYPTANISTGDMLPADGVYAAVAHLPDARRFAAALSVGMKPTFQGQTRTAEAFVLNPDASGSAWTPICGLPEYGWTLRLDVVSRVRDQMRFASVSALSDQIARDCQQVAETIAQHTGQAVP